MIRTAVIVVPCFNEQDRLPSERLQEFVRVSPWCRLLLVNDGSVDRTGELLDALSRSNPGKIETLSLPVNAGKAEAVRHGVNQALQMQVDCIGYWDADLATPLESVEVMRQLLDQEPHIHLVIGSRVRLLGRKIDRRPFRHYLGRVGATLISLSLGMPIYDSQCGAKLFRADTLAQQVFAEPFCSRWLFDVELLARYRMACDKNGVRHDRNLVEYPLESWHDAPGSKVKGRDYLRALWDLLRIRRLYKPGRFQFAPDSNSKTDEPGQSQ